ncbi:hypothetical protein [Algoriphagus marinus]|uniref:hypothetical protein n=1 Tax=Algoriphagus marinus TaxID=1925762 RepID=UPI000B1F1D4E|nr:hypothetical protein [Algoriphagus marinus]
MNEYKVVMACLNEALDMISNPHALRFSNALVVGSVLAVNMRLLKWYFKEPE